MMIGLFLLSTSGNTSTSGDWEGIYFYDNSDDDSIISYCTIEYAATTDSKLIFWGCDLYLIEFIYEYEN
jgi:hypothetical protein